ncbi:hypothetical protein vseg_008709 [Gypsophila vaccaria]
MAVPMCVNSESYSYTKSKQKNDQQTGVGPACCESKLAVMDLLILIAVVTAFGFLLFPCAQVVYVQVAEYWRVVYYVMEEEICENPVVYGLLGGSMVCVTAIAWGIVMWTTRKCGNTNCRGLWKASPEFDIRIDTEDTLRNSASKDALALAAAAAAAAGAGGGGRDLFELPRDRHRELEAELKKIAPPNGRAVLVFRARCGCSLGRMEVPGPKRLPRKIKK